MGADYDFLKVNTLDRKKVKERFKSYQDEARYENGNGGYTGTLAETPDVEFHKGIFTRDAAEEYIYKYAQKWENAICVLVLDDNKMYYLMGACCSC